MKNRYWIKGTKWNGEEWKGWLLFNNKQNAIEHAEEMLKSPELTETHVENIFRNKTVWKKEK